MTLRALTLVDILAQLQSDASGNEVPYNPDETINQLVPDAETLQIAETAATCAAATNYPLAIIEDCGPIGYWRLDDDTSPTSVFDSSPWATATWPKNPGTPSGGLTWQATGAMAGSKGVTCNGTTGFVEVANTAALQRVGDLTIEAWIRPTSLATARTVVSKGVAGEYHLEIGTDGSVTFKQGAAYSQVVAASTSITTNVWYHVVVTRRAIDKAIACYINGVSKYTGNYASVPTATTNVVRLGATSPTAAQWFAGTLDEVAIYARPLTATQAANHYAWGTAATVGSTAYGTGKYGLAQYPKPGPAAGAIYGDPSSLYGSITYA